MCLQGVKDARSHGLGGWVGYKVEGNRGMYGVWVCVGGPIVSSMVCCTEGGGRGGEDRADGGVHEPGYACVVFVWEEDERG